MQPMFRAHRDSDGFTLSELLVVLAVIMLLAIFAVPALARTKHQTKVAACAANLRQVTMAFQIYAQENNDRLPAAGGFWAWDMTWNLGPTLGRYGAPRPALYCPANPGQNLDVFWNYVVNSYRVIGYALTLTGGSSISASNWNGTLTPQPIIFGPGIIPPPLASQRVLVADIVMSQPSQNNEANRATYNYVTILSGFAPAMRSTAHLDRTLPAGGNVGMLDGHVEWRKFQDLHVRTDPGSATPVFWW